MRHLKPWTSFLLATTFLLAPYILTSQCRADTRYSHHHLTRCFDNYDELVAHFLAPERRDQTLRLIQPRNGMTTALPRHHQYNNACFFFSNSAVVEYLGYARFVPRGHFETAMFYPTEYGFDHYVLDVGYRNSPEDLIANSYTFAAISRSILGEERGAIFDNLFENGSLNTGAIDCDRKFTTDNQYGLCTNPGTSSFPEFLQAVGNGCGNGISCSMCANRGMLFYLNRTLADYQQVGANDGRWFRVAGSATKQLAARKLIKAFIDNNTPMVFGVQQGGHFMTMVGYAKLDADGLPTIGIAADPIQLVFWKIDLSNWATLDRYSPWGLVPWNQHLRGGCQSGGWAAALDADPQVSSELRLCAPEPCATGWENLTHPPYYSYELSTREDSRDWVYRFTAFPEDPFIFSARNISTDQVRLRFSDGEHRVRSALAYRYQKARGADTWQRISTFRADKIEQLPVPAGQQGPNNEIIWDNTWTDNFWLVANDVRSDHSQRRTTFVLTFTDGSTQRLELCPPGTYGLRLSYADDDRLRTIARTEPLKHVFLANGAEHQTIPIGRNRSGDKVMLEVRLGAAYNIASAEIQRYSYKPARGTWRPANPAWAATATPSSGTGLSGQALTFRWDEVWPENYWVVADGLDGGDGARKTIIRLKDRSGGVVRVLEVVPF